MSTRRGAVAIVAAALGITILIAAAGGFSIVMIWWRTIIGSVAAALGTTILIANSPWILKKQSAYDLKKLEESLLKRLDGSNEMEASKLSSLLPELQKREVPLYGIVHEEEGAVRFNSSYLKGEVFLDKEKVFYGTRVGLLGLLRWSVLKSFWQAQSTGIKNNFKGDGLLLGSSLVVGPGEQGILFQHRSNMMGDRAEPNDIFEAVKKIKTSN